MPWCRGGGPKPRRRTPGPRQCQEAPQYLSHPRVEPNPSPGQRPCPSLWGPPGGSGQRCPLTAGGPPASSIGTCPKLPLSFPQTPNCPLTIGVSCEPHGRAPRAGQPGVGSQVGRGVSRPAPRACQRRAPRHHEIGVQAVRSTAGGVQTSQVRQLFTLSGTEKTDRHGSPGKEGGDPPQEQADTQAWTAQGLPHRLEGTSGPPGPTGRIRVLHGDTSRSWDHGVWWSRGTNPSGSCQLSWPPRLPQPGPPNPHRSSFSWSRSSRPPSSRSSRCRLRSSTQSSSARPCPAGPQVTVSPPLLPHPFLTAPASLSCTPEPPGTPRGQPCGSLPWNPGPSDTLGSLKPARGLRAR